MGVPVAPALVLEPPAAGVLAVLEASPLLPLLLQAEIVRTAAERSAMIAPPARGFLVM
jgi:hypothetical protein